MKNEQVKTNFFEFQILKSSILKSGIEQELQRDIFEQLDLKNKELIGSGKYGRVYDLGNEKVVKVINRQKIDKDKQSKQAFKRQIQILQTFKKDQNMIKYYGHDDDWNNYYIFLKKYRWNLRNYLIQKRIQIENNNYFGIKIFLQCLFQLTFLHKNNIIHRDIKPQNILLNNQYDIRLSDFGCGKKIHNPILSTMVGTQVYIPPQKTYWSLYQIQLQDFQKVDLWSLAITISQIYIISQIKQQNINCNYIYNPFKSNLKKTNDEVKCFYQKYIIQQDINLPQSMPNFLRILIRKMLIIDPKQRISFVQIYKQILGNWKNIQSQYPLVGNKQYSIKLRECLQIQSKRHKDKKYLQGRKKLLKNILNKIYKPLAQKIKMNQRQNESILKFLYFIIRNMLVVRKQLRQQYDYIDDEIQQRIKSIIDKKLCLQILLLEIQIDIQKQKEMNMLKQFIMGRQQKINIFLKINLSDSIEQIKQGIRQIFLNKQ